MGISLQLVVWGLAIALVVQPCEPTKDAGTSKKPTGFPAYLWTDPEHVTSGWAYDLLRITRHYNPDLDIFVMSQITPSQAGELQRSPLAQWRAVEPFDGPDSRAARIYSSQKKIQAGGEPGHDPRIFQRFCWWADLAKAEGHTRVLTMDSDLALTSNIHESLANFTANVWTPRSWASQFVLWDVKALDAFCNFTADFLALPPAQRQAFYVKAYKQKHKQTHWYMSDMHLLERWLLDTADAKWPSRQISMKNTWNDVYEQETLETHGVWQAIVAMSYFKIQVNGTEIYNERCTHWREMYQWDDDETFGIVPVIPGLGQQYIAMHWQGKPCKKIVHKFYNDWHRNLQISTYRPRVVQEEADPYESK